MQHQKPEKPEKEPTLRELWEKEREEINLRRSDPDCFTEWGYEGVNDDDDADCIFD